MPMTNWTEGYHGGVDYTFSYQRELNPLRLPLSFLHVGLAAPPVATACELGFGQGISLNLHAAASTTQWFGTDFNPAQTAFARELAAAAGSAATLFDQSFADFCRRTDLPEFDFIGMHGVWSWVSDANRNVIVDFVNRKLKPGGVLYVCYNTTLGNAAFIPIQELLTRYVGMHGRPGFAVDESLEQALSFAESVLAASPLYSRENPLATERLRNIRTRDRSYVAHEFINREWAPMSFSRVADWLTPVKLTYACSARYADMVDAWHLTAEQRALLNEIPDAGIRETVRDFMMNQWFRQEYWVKGARKLTLQERAEGLRKQRVVLTAPRSVATADARGLLGNFVPPQQICDPILDALADHGPKTLGEIEQTVMDRGITLAQVVEIALMLFDKGVLAAAQDDAVIKAARKQTDKLNGHLCATARYRATTSILASPVTGAGLIDVGRAFQFFWLAMNQGKKQPAELAAYAAQIFRADGMAILDKERRYLASDGNLSTLTAEAVLFLEKVVPQLRALQIM
jgi:SAM-dependent methyltransferase